MWRGEHHLPNVDDEDVLEHGAVTTLIALIVVHELMGRATVREVAMFAGGRSVSTIHHHLLNLRDAGLVDWEDGKGGTLRPLVGVVEGPWITKVKR